MPEQNNALKAIFEQEMKRQGRDITRQASSYKDHGVACMWWAAQWGYNQGGDNGKVS